MFRLGMDPPEDPPLPLRLLAIRGVATVLVAIAVNATIVSFATGTAVVEPFGALTYPPVTILTIIGTIAATTVYGAITRIWPRPDALFFKVAMIGLGISFVPTLGLLVLDPTATVSAVSVLLLLHVTTASVCLWLLTDQHSPIRR